MKSHVRYIGFGALLIVFMCLAGVQSSRAVEDDAWFFDDFEAKIRQVNEGELKFLAAPPDEPVHHHHNILTIDDQSLQDGWVAMRQCHENMDAVSRAEVVFRGGRIRDLRIAESAAIGEAWVEGNSVQLKQVREGAKLCLVADSQVVHRNDDGSFAVRSGPFMRRFLDGYYPMHVTMDISYPCSAMRFAHIDPEAQDGFEVRAGNCRISLNAWFEGRLNTELLFEPAAPD